MTQNDCNTFELYCIIVDNCKGTHVIKLARQMGVTGATVLLGRGTVRSGVLSFLGINDIRREVVLMAAKRDIGDKALLKIAEEFSFHKPKHGIGFSVPLTEIIGAKNCVIDANLKKKEEKRMYDLVFVIVDRGNAEFVVDAATSAGANGATVLNARGSGIHETQKIFNIAIEPEKELILILTKKDMTGHITDAIKKEVNIEKPGKGIIFVMDVTQTVGLYEK